MHLGAINQLDDRISSYVREQERGLMFITHERLRDILETEFDFAKLNEQSYKSKEYHDSTESKAMAREQTRLHLPLGKMNDSVLLQRTRLYDSNPDVAHLENHHAEEKSFAFPHTPASNQKTTTQKFSFDESPPGTSTFKENKFSFDDICCHNQTTNRFEGNRANDDRDSGPPGDSEATVSTAERDHDNLLLLDCRSFIAYNAGHVAFAQNVCFPNIVQRRCKKKMAERAAEGRKRLATPDADFFPGAKLSVSDPAATSKPLISLESIVTDARARQKLLSDGLDLVVVYDEGDEQPAVEGTPFSEKVMLVLDALCSSLPQGQRSKLRHLQGGYSTFSRHYPHLIERQKADLKQLPLPSPSLSNGFTPEKDRVKWSANDDKGDPTEILPWLFLGSAHHARRTDRLAALGVTALLNVASSETSSGEEGERSIPSSTFRQACIPVVDSLTSEIGCHFDSAIAFIESVRGECGKVLVHCSAGVSRSPAVCLAYLISSFEYGLEEAYDFLRSKRACIAPNLNFMRQLQEFETRRSEGPTSTARGGTKSSSSRRLVESERQSDSDPSRSDSSQSVTVCADGLGAVMHFREGFGSLRRRRTKLQVVQRLASLCIGRGSRSRSLRMKINKMFHRNARSSHFGNTLGSKKLMTILLEASNFRPPLLRSLNGSSASTNSESQLFLLSVAEKPLELCCFNGMKRPDKLLSSMVRDLKFRVETFYRKETKNGDSIGENDRNFCTEENPARNSLSIPSVLGQEAADNFSDAIDPGNITGRSPIFVKCAKGDTDDRSEGTADNFQHRPQQKQRLSVEASEQTASPAKKARPSSLMMMTENNFPESKALRATLQFSVDSLPSAFPRLRKHCRRVHDCPLLASTLSLEVLLQQRPPYESNRTSAGSVETAARPRPPLPLLNVHAHSGGRKPVVSLLTPTCNREAAFSFEPCQAPVAAVGGLAPSPTVAHGPLLSPS